MLGKKSSEKSAKNVFYIHTNIVTKKWEGKTRETIFPETQELCDQKMLGKKLSEKVRKTFFYIHTNIVTKKWGGKTRETIFPETQE